MTTITLRLAIFGAGSVLLACLSRHALGLPRSHGFFRFFAWETILALCCLNVISVGQWFGDPLSVRQLISWTLLVASIVPVLSGTHQLHRFGRPDARSEGERPALLGFEKTTQLVTTGIYRYIRHPLYSSLLLLAWGVCCKHPSGAGAALALGATGFLLLTARAEEAENLRYFGASYEVYMRATRRFIPFLF